MSTRTPNVTVERDGNEWSLRDPAHVAAFLAAGWKLKEDEQPARKTRKKTKE